ncbi:MAG: FKBP-type peptidyl-prolyl cis-trans isomerase [Bacteroidaceae bacterium]|nr:FKBP-type peptidyl-prolyl cis-trans isomerase [Bacteroidaceae bacterium]
MKRLVRIIVLGVLLYVAWLAFLCSCSSSSGEVGLRNVDDSLSYAVSMLVSEELPGMLAAEGIDSTTIDDFIRGVRAAFPLDDSPESRAYLNGVVVAVEAMDMLNRANKSIYPDGNDKKVDRKLFVEGIVAASKGDSEVMDMAFAIDFYNQHIFRARSEQFISENASRPGVVTLPSGVQYKVSVMGSGAKAGNDDTVKCIYKGTYPNGAVFDSSRGEAVDLEVASLVPGLAEVVMTLPAGTQCMVYVPWNLAYGAKGSGKISPYSALVYDIEIIDAK